MQCSLPYLQDSVRNVCNRKVLHFEKHWLLTYKHFFVQSAHTKLDSPKAMYWKISSVAPPWRTWIKDGKEKIKSTAPDRIWTHDLSIKRRALYRCATTAAPGVQTSCSGFSFHWSPSFFLAWLWKKMNGEEETEEVWKVNILPFNIVFDFCYKKETGPYSSNTTSPWKN